ncbi:MAG: glycosyltransferase family 39 protein [Chloroflexi bacterium]|nr:glycosyltransferase family 39 protein [Chloroflexota bacterium]
MTLAWRRRELLALPGLLLVAAALRLPDLATRGTWDADQGHDMLTLRALIRDGVVPLLGPPTSIGDVHHGALYYYLLAPAAALTGGDSPLAVVAWIALAGIAAVGVTWWLARSVAGPVAGFVAGLAMAISPAAVDESTFIWNPNLIALSSAVALAGAWRAWTGRRPGWWLVAAVGTAITMQSHVLGVTLLPVVGALLVADIRRRVAPTERRTLIRAGVGGLAIVALSFLPLVIHELTTDFSEVQAALAYLRAGGDPSSVAPIPRFLVVASRVLSWPLVGLITTGLSAAVVAIIGVVALAGWRFVAAVGLERVAVRWLALGLAWTSLALTVISPSLATVVEGLPNDHYHAFGDPMVFVLLGVGLAALWQGRERAVAADSARAAPTEDPAPAGVSAMTPGRLLAVVVLVAVVAWAVPHQPPAVAADGGFPAAESAAARIEAAIPQGSIAIGSLPVFKTAEAYVYPLRRDGRQVDSVSLAGRPPGGGGPLVVVCDSLFETAIGAPCGGPAEAAAVGGRSADLVDRFRAAPRQTISIYRAAPVLAVR